MPDTTDLPDGADEFFEEAAAAPVITEAEQARAEQKQLKREWKAYRKKKILDDWTPDPWDDPEELYDFETERLRPERFVPRMVGLLAAIALVGALLVGGGIGIWTLRQVNPSGTAGDKINFTVEEKDTIDSVSVRMEQEGIVTSARVFRWYVKQKGGFELQPGYFTVRERDNMGNLLKSLKTPPAATFDRVTFPEGFTVDQFGLRLSKTIARLSSERFAAAAADGQVRSVFQPPEVTSLEGMLFPDTYQVGGNEDERKVLEKFLKQMERIGAKPLHRLKLFSKMLG